MNIRRSLLIAVSALLCSPALAQYAPRPGAGGQGDGLVMNTLWRIAVPTPAGTDYATTHHPAERDAYGPAFQLFYVPADNAPGTYPLYRLLGFNGWDHMDSSDPGEGGYATDAFLGYPWLSPTATPGLTQLWRVHKNWDHALAHDNEDLVAHGLSGYGGTEYMGRYGYRRYGEEDDNDTAFLSLSAGGVTIKSNRVAGGALWSWQWNGVEFVNVWDYGRQIQSSLAIGNDSPTEAGSSYSYPDLAVAARQGAPLLLLTNYGPAAEPTQESRAVPLNWDSYDASHPVVWKDMQIGKRITLNFLGMGAVARYTTIIVVPENLYQPAGQAPNAQEIPSVYLTGRFKKFYQFDAADEESEPIPRALCETPAGDGFFPESGFGGVIAATETGDLAFGIYGVGVGDDGSVTESNGGFTCAYFNAGIGDLNDPAGRASAKIRALNTKLLVKGTNEFTTYLISGTLAEVEAHMRALKAADVR